MIEALVGPLARLKSRMPLNRAASIAILVLAAFLRLWQLGYPAKLVFDETYYVKDAWTLITTGTEKSWPADANSAFESGQVDGYLADPSFVVHPPLGKWIIGAGMAIFGADNSFSWRIAVAILGIASVALIMAVAKEIFHSQAAALLAGFLLAIDGHAIVLSRTGLLDNILAFFVLLAFWLLIKDRSKPISVVAYAPRPWLLACGAVLGAATAVKWSGAYVFLGFAVYLAISEIKRWHQSGRTNWIISATKSALVNGLAAFAAFCMVYLLSWSGWLFTGNGYDRNTSENPLVALWNYHLNAYSFHVGLSTPHSYASNPLTWTWLIRPTSFFYEGLSEGEAGCRSIGGCSSAITALGNPIIWWAGSLAMLATLFVFAKYRDRVSALILLGFSVGYLPWLLYPNRTVFQFYSIVFLPFLVLAIVHLTQRYVRGSADQESTKRYVVGAAIFALAVSLFFLPIWNGTWIPYWFWQIHMWLPTWI